MGPAAAQALAGTHTVAVKAEVWNGTTKLATLAETGTSGVVTAGSVSDDETQLIHRTTSLTVASTALAPAAAGDLLHPLSGNELHLFRGVVLPGGPVYAPLGVFRMSMPVITDTGQEVTIAITGNDRSGEIQARLWTGPFTGAAGKTVDQAIEAILVDRWGATQPPLTFNLTPSSVMVPPGTTLGVQYTSYGTQAQSGSTSGGNNPLQDIANLATSAGMQFFFDRNGVATLRPIPEPGGVPVSFSYAEGTTCTMTSLTRTLDSTKFCNGVIVIGSGARITNADGSTSPGAPVTGAAWDNSPSSTIGVLGRRPAFILDANVSTVAEATAAAQAQLPLVLASLDETSFTATEDPRVDSGDANSIVRSRIKVSATYIVSVVTHPLDVGTAMQVTNRSASIGPATASTLSYGVA